jgi:hypothetical protein
MALAAAAGIGGLTLAASGVAGATGSTGSSSGSLQKQASGLSKGFAQDLKHFNCGTASTRLARAQKLSAEFAKREANLNAHLTNAQKANHAKRVTFFQNRLAAVQKEQTRLMGPRFRAGEAKVAKLAQQKCHINAPTSTNSPTSV